MDLTECHRMEIPRDPMCGLYVIKNGHGYEAIYNLVKETETGHRLPHFKCLPVQLSETSCTDIIA